MLSGCKCLTGSFLVVLFMVTSISSDNKFPILERTNKGLEKVTSGKSLTSGLTGKDLLGLIKEYEEASDADKTEFKKDPIRRLIRDFVIIPSSRFKNELATNKEYFAANMVRIQDAYQLFKPGYLGRFIGTFYCRLKIPKLTNLYNKLKTNQPTTIDDWILAKNEAVIYQHRMLELVEHDDIYQHQNELKQMLNLFNSVPYGLLARNVLPAVTKKSDPETLRKLYCEILASKGLNFREGNLVPLDQARDELRQG